MFERHYPNSKKEVVYASRLMTAGEVKAACQEVLAKDRSDWARNARKRIRKGA